LGAEESGGVRLAIRPLTPALWPAFAELFGRRGACNGCWCMYWRLGAAYRHRPAAANRRAFRRCVAAGPPPGLIAFQGPLAIGWCQVTPRRALPWLERKWSIARDAGGPVWSLSCLFVRVGHRRKRVSEALIRAAVALARRSGAAVLEAYPLDRRHSPSATGTGFVPSFARAGFRVVARRTPARPVMRRTLRAAAERVR
jgi:hypothetical protein